MFVKLATLHRVISFSQRQSLNINKKKKRSTQNRSRENRFTFVENANIPHFLRHRTRAIYFKMWFLTKFVMVIDQKIPWATSVLHFFCRYRFLYLTVRLSHPANQKCLRYSKHVRSKIPCYRRFPSINTAEILAAVQYSPQLIYRLELCLETVTQIRLDDVTTGRFCPDQYNRYLMSHWKCRGFF